MTTIVYNPSEGVIAYDSRVTAGEQVVTDDYDKRHQFEHLLIFAAGDMGDDERIAKAYISSEPDVLFDAIIVDGNEVYMVTSCEGGYQKFIADFPIAIGSGEKHAITALDMGASASEAVKMAIKRDTNSGGKVRTHKI